MGNYGKMILKQQHLNLCFLLCSFSALSSLTAFMTEKNSFQSPLQQTSHAAVAQECIYLKNCVGVCELSEECVLRSQGESFLVSVPAIVLSPWKSMSVVGRQSLLSCLSVLVEKLPPTDRPAVYLWGGQHIHREHTPTGCRTELCFARCLLYV